MAYFCISNKKQITFSLRCKPKKIEEIEGDGSKQRAVSLLYMYVTFSYCDLL